MANANCRGDSVATGNRKIQGEAMRTVQLREALELAEAHPLELCECGTVTLGGCDVVIQQDTTKFPEHNCGNATGQETA